MNELSVKFESLEFPSADGKTTIKGKMWAPSGEAAAVRGVVQIVHGMSEHVARYDGFARYLVSRGFAVCGNDHIGHGGSVCASEDLGHISLSAGKEALIADVHALRALATERFGVETPFLLFGHSMGSFIAYAYLARHARRGEGHGLSGCVLCGTARMPVALSKGGNALARILAILRGIFCGAQRH